jgi:hypothetical protein
MLFEIFFLFFLTFIFKLSAKYQKTYKLTPKSLRVGERVFAAPDVGDTSYLIDSLLP